MGKTLEFLFDVGSPTTYLAHKRMPGLIESSADPPRGFVRCVERGSLFASACARYGTTVSTIPTTTSRPSSRSNRADSSMA